MAAGASSSRYRGIELLTLSGACKSKMTGSMAFLDESTLAAGDADSVKAAIDRHAAAAVFAGPLADRARQISAVDDVWLASLTRGVYPRIGPRCPKPVRSDPEPAAIRATAFSRTRSSRRLK